MGLREVFEPFGDIRDITVKTKPGSANSYVFIEYGTTEAAKAAQEAYYLSHIDSRARSSKARNSRWSSARASAATRTDGRT